MATSPGTRAGVTNHVYHECSTTGLFCSSSPAACAAAACTVRTGGDQHLPVIFSDFLPATRMITFVYAWRFQRGNHSLAFPLLICIPSSTWKNQHIFCFPNRSQRYIVHTAVSELEIRKKSPNKIVSFFLKYTVRIGIPYTRCRCYTHTSEFMNNIYILYIYYIYIHKMQFRYLSNCADRILEGLSILGFGESGA